MLSNLKKKKKKEDRPQDTYVSFSVFFSKKENLQVDLIYLYYFADFFFHPEVCFFLPKPLFVWKAVVLVWACFVF